MTKRYVQCGIDHGTTNSCIAIMDGDKPRVIKPNPMDDTMPSAVYYDKRGRRFVGQTAIEAMWVSRGEDGNGHTGYKLRMGQDDRFEFSAARKVMTAPELGSIVIGELLRFYREETGDDPKACVISVPAKFDQSACDGTRKAAKLAGLLYYPLPQEPVVAALAYGLTQKDEHAQWMVFDLGGGTLDVSLVLVRNGELVVPQNGHMGDVHLGGRRFDRELVDYALSQLSQDYDLKEFKEKSPKYGPAYGTLMLAAETAKIELSEKDRAVIQVDGVLCEDERGKPVKVAVPITRSQYAKLVARDVEKAVHQCQLLLSRNRLSSRSVDRLILIGGPTKTPYIRQVLQDHLKIPLDTSIDPMTAVAQGAAIHGTTVEIPREITWGSGVDKPLSEVELQLEYEAKSSLPTYCVAGKVNGPAALEDGVSIEIYRADGLWSSGQIPVDGNGFFNTEVSLIAQETPTRSRFTTKVINRAGELLSSVEEPEIWYPFPAVTVRLASSLLVAVKGNLTAKLIDHGSELPAHRTESFVTTKSVRKGNSDDVLLVPVLEAVTNLFGAEDSHADCNFHVGTLVIAGSDERVTQDIPAGSDVEVTLHADESRTIRAQAYVPLLDEQFEGEFFRESFGFELNEITERFETLKRSLSGSENLQLDYPIPEVEQDLAEVRRLAIVESISKDLERAHAGEQDARNSAYKAILAFAGSLNHIHRLQVDARVRQLIEKLEPVLRDEEAKELADIKSQYESLPKSNTEQLLELESRLLDLDFQVRQRPLFDLTLDWTSFPPTFYGNPEQLESFRDAEHLVLEITEQRRNGGEVLQAQFDQCARAHDRLLKAWPELLDWRSKKFKEVVEQGRTEFDISDIEKAGKKSN
ncbi:MAG TPA: Hsp70 family protein [Pyrinomonadaceae bacterium]|nr:Hsp70 family protein [Pyrinomonadaceae bacterium]